MLSNRWFVVILVFSAILSGACRSRKRNAQVGVDAVKVIVALKNMDDVNKSKLVALDYEMKCSEAVTWSKGEMSNEDKQEVTFLIKRAKSGDYCDVRVLHRNPPDDFIYIAAPGVVYEADGGVKLTTRENGQLAGEGLLRRAYKLRPGKARLKIPVQFKDDMPADTSGFIAALKCAPEFEGLATSGLTITDKAKKSGHFIFDSGIQPGKEFVCHQMQVNRRKDRSLYYGNFNYTIKQLVPDEELVAPLVELDEVEVLNTEGVIIVVTPGEACKEGEVFDVDLGRCIPRPQ